MKKIFTIISILFFHISVFSGERKYDFPHGFYFSVLITKHTGVPTSYVRGSLNYYNSDPPAISNSSKGPAFAIGGTLLFEEFSVFTEAEFEYSYAKFSDWRITNRRYDYYQIGLKVGYLPKSFPIALYGTFGGGGMHQSDFVEFDYKNPTNLYEYEALQQSEDPFYFGIGFKLGILRHFCIRWEFHDSHISRGDTGDEYVYYVNTPKPTKTGKRMSLGIDFYL